MFCWPGCFDLKVPGNGGSQSSTSTIPSTEEFLHLMGQGLGTRGLFRLHVHVFSVPCLPTIYRTSWKSQLWSMAQ